MTEIFSMDKFYTYKEDNRREVKSATGGLPKSLWETYSAFANTIGGVIILGVKENDDGSWITSGLKKESKSKILKDLWDTLNNREKVSVNIISENNIKTYEYNEDIIIVIYVPSAYREDKPVYINNSLFNGSFRRNHEGDYHCTPAQIKAMLRDQTETTQDMIILESTTTDVFNIETVHSYRNSHRTLRPGHPFERLTDEEYLRCIGATGRSQNDGKLYPTAAGLLMFGNEYDIVRTFPDYFLDYREQIDVEIRWTDRVQSSSGEWSGNLFDFFFRVYNKIVKDLKVPFKLNGVMRIDDTPVHNAIREALANCIINADYYGMGGIVIIKESDKISFRNPGCIRIGKEQMKIGGISDPRNKALMKMFNLLEIGERAGSGVPNIFNVWADNKWKEPVIEETFNPDITKLVLNFVFDDKNERQKTSDKNERQKMSDGNLLSKTKSHMTEIVNYLTKKNVASTKEISEIIKLSEPQTRKILNRMDNVEVIGSSNKTRQYKLKLQGNE